MIVTATRVLEDCLDGSGIREYALDEPVTRATIELLGALGELGYYREFARPYYSIVQPGIWNIKGVEGNRTIRVTYFKALPETEVFERRFLDTLAHTSEHAL